MDCTEKQERNDANNDDVLGQNGDGWSMNLNRIFNGPPLDVQWISVGCSMNLRWIFNGSQLDVRWIVDGSSLDLPLTSVSFSMDFRWMCGSLLNVG